MRVIEKPRSFEIAGKRTDVAEIIFISNSRIPHFWVRWLGVYEVPERYRGEYEDYMFFEIEYKKRDKGGSGSVVHKELLIMETDLQLISMRKAVGRYTLIFLDYAKIIASGEDMEL